MTKMNFTPADEFVDEVWGKIGTPERNKMEEQVKEEANSYLLGEATLDLGRGGKVALW
jgi:hypothetical protein